MNSKFTKIILVILLCLFIGVTVVAADSSMTQMTDVFAFADGSDAGDAVLHRSNNGVNTLARLEGLPPGHIFTVWWIVWNTPEGCFVAWACSEPDLFNPDAGLAIGYAGGGVVSSNGSLTIPGRLKEGATLQGFPYPEFQAIGVELTETTLIDVDHAEIHLVIRTHQERIPGMVQSALRSFNGSCVYDPPIVGSEPAYGIPGPNTCTDTHFAVFASPAAP